MEDKTIKIPFFLFVDFFHHWKKQSKLYQILQKLKTNIDLKIYQYTFDFSIHDNLPPKLRPIFVFLFRKYIFFLFAAFLKNQNPLSYLVSSIYEYLIKTFLLYNLIRTKYILVEINQKSNMDLFFPFEYQSEIQIIKNLNFDILYYKVNLYYLDTIFKGYYIDLKSINIFKIKNKNKIHLKLKNIQEVSNLSFLSNHYNKQDFRNHLFFFIGTNIWIYSIDLKFFANQIYQVLNANNFTYYIPIKGCRVKLIDRISLEKFYLRKAVNK